MMSDNKSIYLSAADEHHDLMNSQEVKDLLAEHRVTWTFIPIRAPWRGGFWERVIGLMKTTIKKVLSRAFVTFDELRTLLTEIEATLNDRPLTYVSTNEDDPIALTPSHLLYCRPSTTLPYISVDNEEFNDPSYGNHNALNERYQHLSYLQSSFWKRWSTEYLTALRERHRLTATGIKTNSTQIGDIVLVHSDVDKRMKWKIMKVHKLIYEKDGLVRSADIKSHRVKLIVRFRNFPPMKYMYSRLIAWKVLTSCQDLMFQRCRTITKRMPDQNGRLPGLYERLVTNLCILRY
ncbi:uncharacterized protein [Ptychodera flava]|uniref:uncharacterized protein n=1 Tax=Ptychodera flava TaxID=63121 RepID=UPI003969CA49